jgi:hypothetical protein
VAPGSSAAGAGGAMSGGRTSELPASQAHSVTAIGAPRTGAHGSVTAELPAREHVAGSASGPEQPGLRGIELVQICKIS